MAAIIDKLKNALDPEVAAALDTAQGATKLVADLEAKQVQMRAALAKTEEERDKAALPADMGGDDAKYQKLDKEAQRLDAELKRNLAAIREAGRRKVEAEALLRKQRAGADLKNARKFGRQRQEAMDEIAAGLAQAVRGWQRHHELNERILIWRPELAMNAGGLLLRKDEIRMAVEMELSRISSPPPLDAKAPPIFPGGRAMILAGNPTKFKPLPDVAKEANDYLARKVEQLAAPQPAAAPQSEPSKAAPAVDPDDGLLTTTQPTDAPAQPKFTAAQVMASLGRRELKV